MLTGIVLALLSGCCWCVIGIVFSRAADRGMHPALMCALCGGGVALVSSMWIDVSALNDRSMNLVIRCMILSGLASTGGMMALQMAMRRGGHSAAWAVAQSALVCPFLVIVFLHGEHQGGLAWGGLACIIVSLILLAEREKKNIRIPQTWNWFGWAMLAWVLIGFQQSSFQWPSLVATDIDPAGIRVPLLMASSTLSALTVFYFLPTAPRPASYLGQPKHPIFFLALIGTLANVIGLPSMVSASDRLARHASAGIAYPVAIATCIVLFGIYSFLHRKERPTFRGYAGLSCCVCGVILMSL